MSLAALITAFVVSVLPVTPTEPTLVAMGALTSVTHVSPVGVILVAGLGCSVSDHMLYAAGRWGGGRLLGYLGSAFTGNPLDGLGISLIIAVVVGLASRRVLHRRHTVIDPVTGLAPEHTATPERYSY
jgi:hypothetical protein